MKFVSGSGIMAICRHYMLDLESAIETNTKTQRRKSLNYNKTYIHI